MKHTEIYSHIKNNYSTEEYLLEKSHNHVHFSNIILYEITVYITYFLSAKLNILVSKQYI